MLNANAMLFEILGKLRKKNSLNLNDHIRNTYHNIKMKHSLQSLHTSRRRHNRAVNNLKRNACDKTKDDCLEESSEERLPLPSKLHQAQGRKKSKYEEKTCFCEVPTKRDEKASSCSKDDS